METEQEVIKFLDNLGDTAGPDEDDENDTGDPEHVIDDAGDPAEDAEETGAPAAQAKNEIARALEAFRARNGGKLPNYTQLQGILKQQRRQAAKKATTRVRRRLNFAYPPAVQRPTNPRVVELRNDVFADFRKKHGSENTIQTKGYYYATFETVFDGVGDGNTAALILPVGNDASASAPSARCFHEAIGDDSRRLGIGHKVNPADTNLQYPGKNLFPSEIFVITHYAMEISGVRVKYDETAINNAGIDGAIKNILLGQAALWDDSQSLLPDIFNDYDGRCRLLDAMFTASTLHFTWTKSGSGGNTDTTTLLINALQKVPVTRVSVNESSGGSNLIEVNDGYVWRLDQNEQTQWGIFNALIRTHEAVAFGIKPVKIPGNAASAMVPQKLGLYLRFTVFGDTIRLRRDLTTSPERFTTRR